MQQKVKIFMCSKNRWRAYKALRLEALQAVPEAFGSSYKREINFSETLWQQRASNALVAEVNGELIGMCGFFVDNEYEKLKHIANFVAMYVKPKYRGIGVGKQLMIKQIELIKLNPEIIKIKLGVVSTQIAAKALYEKMGFKEVGIFKKELFVNNTYYDEYYMEMLL